jgi:hypothetical protein
LHYPEGVHEITSHLTLNGVTTFAPGAVLKPMAGVLVTLGRRASIIAGHHQIFENSGGGRFDGDQMMGVADAAWFPGSCLGAMLNNALSWQFFQIDIPPAPDWRITQTVKLEHGCTIRCMWHGYPRHVVCQTNGKPVFEVVGSKRHWKLIGGVFDGASTGTPSCFLLAGRDDAIADGGGQCGDLGVMSLMQVSGNWGVGCIINIGGEILLFDACNFWVQGRGDRPHSGHPGAAVTMGNADYWNLPYSYNKPRAKSASTSANVFQNCDIRAGAGGSVVLLVKGQVEDTTVIGSYLNGTGRCQVLVEPGTDVNGYRTSARRLYIGGGGRSECNGMASGCPTVIVDGMDQGGQLHCLTFGEFGHFLGATKNSTPIVRTERGGLIHAFTMHQGGHIEWTDKLLEHTTADLNWADIRCHFKVNINCGTRTIAHSDIKIGGTVTGNVASSSNVRTGG